MFDNMYLLAEGQCIYQGNVGGLVPFLSSMGLDCPSYHNPADYGEIIFSIRCDRKFPRSRNHVEEVKKKLLKRTSSLCIKL